MEILNLIVSVLVLLGTVALIWLTVLLVRPRHPTMRLDQLRVRVHKSDGSYVTTGENASVTLVFVNDGPGIAPALNAYVRGGIPNYVDEEFQFPPDGSPTVAMGDRFEIEVSAQIIDRPEDMHFRKYTHGDDYFFDLSRLTVRFEWGANSKRRSSTVKNLHALQQYAAPQVENASKGSGK